MIENIRTLLELISQIYCLSYFYGRKMKYNIYTILLVITQFIIITGINEGNLSNHMIVIAYLAILIYCVINYDADIVKALINCILSCSTISILELFYFLIISTIFYHDKVNITFELIIMMLTFITILFLGWKINLSRISELLLKRKVFRIILILFTVGFVGSCIYKVKQQGFLMEKDYMTIICFFILLFILLNEWEKSKGEIEKSKIELNMNRLYYSTYEELFLLVRETQHDVKNHISAIYSMIYTTDNYDELVSKQKKYCELIMDANEVTSILLSVENPLLAGFLYKQIQDANNQDVKVNYKLAFSKTPIKISEYKIVEIISVLFSNAIEAVDQLEKDKRIIKLEVLRENSNLLISVTNPGNISDFNNVSDFFRIGYSNKGKNRGIGLSKLKRMVKELSGKIYVENEIESNQNNITFKVELNV